MDYKQHKGELRGRIKDKVRRKNYNKKIRSEDNISPQQVVTPQQVFEHIQVQEWKMWEKEYYED